MKTYEVLVKKKGVSPVVATVLLIAMVMIIGLIIFLWFKNMVGEEVVKFDKNVKLVCGDVNLLASYDNELRIANVGNVPVYDVKLEISNGGSRNTINLATESSNWPSSGLKQGGVFSGYVSGISSADKVILTPVLLGKADNVQKSHVCDKQYGYEVEI